MTDGGRGEQLAWHGREDVRAATSIMRIIVNLIAKRIVLRSVVFQLFHDTLTFKCEVKVGCVL